MTTPSNTPQLERKSLQTFALHAIFLSLLLGVLPSLDAAYAYGFQALGNTVFGNIGPELQVRYRWVPPGERNQAGEIEMNGFVTEQLQSVWESSYSVRDRGYGPTSVLVALILATPASRRRHAAAAVLGALALNVFYLMQTGLLAATLFASVEPDLIAAGEVLASLRPAAERFFSSPLPRYAAVFAVWAVAAAPAQGLDTRAASERISKLLGTSKAR